jgi:hypothetical protein
VLLRWAAGEIGFKFVGPAARWADENLAAVADCFSS